MSGRKKLDDLMEAVTFAEAGETEHARRLASELFPERRERILAVSAAPGFSSRMIEKSLALAERLGCGLVALSPPPALVRWVPGLAARGRGGWLSPEVFRARAAERGIPFAHAERAGDLERAVAVARRRFRRIAFLLLDGHLGPRTRFAGVNLPIFVVADR